MLDSSKLRSLFDPTVTKAARSASTTATPTPTWNCCSACNGGSLAVKELLDLPGRPGWAMMR